MTSSPNDKAPLPTYSESQALAGFPDDQQPTNIDEAQHEEELRPLPVGWIRQWDSSTENYFYVDTTANPPLSVWEHPDDLIEEQHFASIASSSRPIEKEIVEARVPWDDIPRPAPFSSSPIEKEMLETRVPWEDLPRPATPSSQHTSLVDRTDFIFPARKRKHHGPIGLLESPFHQEPTFNQEAAFNYESAFNYE
ncbi:hypothetical protein FRC00_014566 [Tulasnella sp. 408]|nr:hypothetical protein FRC00_014566 [Tulasnella sp. 408]